MKSTNLVVYTAIFGDYDDLIDPPHKFEGCDFICFTDNKNLKSQFWDIKLVQEYNVPPNIMNRKYKMMPHIFLKDWDKSLYIDGNVCLKKNPITLAKIYLSKYDIALPKHYARNCIYEEAYEIIKLKKCDINRIISQIEYYKKNNFPHKFGLAENNVIFRNHNKREVINLMNLWWEHFIKFSQRDQLSLMYCVWKNNVNMALINESDRNGSYFNLFMHKSCLKKGFWGKLYNLKNNYICNHPNNWIVKVINFIKNSKILKYKNE